MQFAPPHANIVRAHGVLHSMHYFCIMMEYVGVESLAMFSRRTVAETGAATLAPDLVASICKQQLSGVVHLHRHMVSHRDIAPWSWMLAESGAGRTVRLAEFGIATHVVSTEELLKSGCGSPPFCAPEMMGRELVRRDMKQHANNEAHPALEGIPGARGYDGFRADLWSLGLNHVELLLGPGSVQKLLGWTPQRPQDEWECLRLARRLPELVVQALQDDTTPIAFAVRKQVLADPTARWSVEAVAEVHCRGIDETIVGWVDADTIPSDQITHPAC